VKGRSWLKGQGEWPITSVSCSDLLADIRSEDKDFGKLLSENKNFWASCGHVWGLGGQALKPFSPKQPRQKSDKSALRSCCRCFRIFAYLDSMVRKRKATELDSSTASRSSKSRVGPLARTRPWGNSDTFSVLTDIDSDLFRVLRTRFGIENPACMSKRWQADAASAYEAEKPF
jgi:hypothetical protein